MPRLDPRLRLVATQVRCRVHADVGSDHGHLLKALLSSGRIERGIAIENKQAPLENSRRTLSRLPVSVRLADGLEGLHDGEADCLSLCGLGGRSIAKILDAFPGRVPDTVIVQPNDRIQDVRRWGLQSGFQLVDERVTSGRRPFCVLRFEKAPSETGHSDSWIDPVYQGIDPNAAILFGPHLIRRWEPEFVRRLTEERDYLLGLHGLGIPARERFEAIAGLLTSREA